MVGGEMGRMISFMIGFMFGIEGLRIILSIRGITPISILIGFSFLVSIFYTIYVWTRE